jgi:aryl-alcohol dehydrogenase-like predicted oxidoreductase
MELRRLGDSGLLVSAVGLGTNNFGGRLTDDQAKAVLDEAIAQGINFIDTADIYGKGSAAGAGGSEAQIGRVLGGNRDKVLLATKFGMAFGDSAAEKGASRHWMMRQVEASLRRMQTEYIDLYQVHAPDPATPIEETLRGLDDLVASGKVRYVGHSNFAAWQIADADWTARTAHLARPISAQMHYNLLVRKIQDEVIPVCRSHGLGIIPYFPLHSGFLTGKYTRSGEGKGRLSESARKGETFTEANFDRLDAFTKFANDQGHSMLELAFGWLLSQPIVASVIASASSAEQVRANVAAGEWRLSAGEMDAFAAI